MTMTAHERERMMRLSENQAAGLKELDMLKGAILDIKKRIDDMHNHLKEVTDSICSIRVQNEGHEEKLAMLQELTASLGESVVGIEKCCKRLKHMLFGFVGIMIVLGFLAGLLGEEIAPKTLKWVWALIGL